MGEKTIQIARMNSSRDHFETIRYIYELEIMENREYDRSMESVLCQKKRHVAFDIRVWLAGHQWIIFDRWK